MIEPSTSRSKADTANHWTAIKSPQLGWYYRENLSRVRGLEIWANVMIYGILCKKLFHFKEVLGNLNSAKKHFEVDDKEWMAKLIKRLFMPQKKADLQVELCKNLVDTQLIEFRTDPSSHSPTGRQNMTLSWLVRLPKGSRSVFCVKIDTRNVGNQTYPDLTLPNLT